MRHRKLALFLLFSFVLTAAAWGREDAWSIPGRRRRLKAR
jgi:hypothetical protein